MNQSIQSLHRAANQSNGGNGAARRHPNEAHWYLPRAQTDCDFFSGEARVARCHRDLDEACRWLNQPSSNQTAGGRNRENKFL